MNNEENNRPAESVENQTPPAPQPQHPQTPQPPQKPSFIDMLKNLKPLHKALIGATCGVVVLAGVLTAILVPLSLRPTPGGSTPPPSDDIAVEGEEELLKLIGECSDTYQGSLSAESYASQTDAAKAFVQKELSGKKFATNVTTDSKGQLTDEQISALPLSAEEKEGIVSVEEVEISYDLTTGQAAMAARAGKTVVKVYIIKYSNENFKYYSPAVQTGEMVTYSYYSSIFDSEQYKNCTVSQSANVALSGKVSTTIGGKTQSLTMNVTMKTEVSAKFTENAIYYEQTTIIEMAYSDPKGFSKEELEVLQEMMSSKNTDSVKLYLEKSESGEMICYVKLNDAGWNNAPLETSGLTLDQMYPFSAQQTLDYTYFEKTDFGCTLTQENFSAYINDVFSFIKNIVPSGSNVSMNAPKGYANYYVTNGVLSGVLVKLESGTTMQSEEGAEAVNMNLIAKTTAQCYDYGKTEITSPVA